MANITRITRKLIDAAASIAEVDCENPEFLHAVLAQVSLPRNPTKERSFTRSSGAASVLIKAGDWYDGIKWVPQPLPSGTRPRLVLIHACSEAVRTKSPHVEIGDSVSDFLRQLNIDTSGRGMAYFRREMIALSVCEMTFGWRGPEGPEQAKASPVRKFRAWSANEGGQACIWPGYMELDQIFFDTLLAHAVPLDPRAITALKGSALALDTYTWLAHRLCRVRPDAGVMVSWGNLHEQFGHGYASVKKFKQKFLHALRQAKTVYPAARIEQVRGGLRLLPSPPPIARKAVVVKLPAPADTPATEKRPALPDLPLRHRITEDGLDRLRDACPGWDRQWLVLRYLAFMADKPAPKNADASLVAWGKKFTKGKAP
jgi:hypothetical protein